MMNKPPVKMARMRQEWLANYLDIAIDPYDFMDYLPEWAEESRIRKDSRGMAIDRETSAQDLSPRQLKSFTDWLIKNRKGEELVGTGAIHGVPAYLYFDEVSRLPAGTWLVHFTSANPFEAFERGTTLEGLALSTHKREKDEVDCLKNLTDEIGIYDAVYGFAFEAQGGRVAGHRMDVMSHGLSKYGDNAVLFQTDAGVRAWHIGDEEYQVIFPLCSEYNVIPMLNPDPAEIKIETETGEEAVFGNLAELIGYVESGESRGGAKLGRAR